MSDLLYRAGAIHAAASMSHGIVASGPLVSTLIQSCEELTAAGSAAAALELIGLTESLRESMPIEWCIRLDVTRARALSTTGSLEECLRICRETRATNAANLGQMPDLAVELRIIEGSALWQLNACDEAIYILNVYYALGYSGTVPGTGNKMILGKM